MRGLQDEESVVSVRCSFVHDVHVCSFFMISHVIEQSISSSEQLQSNRAFYSILWIVARATEIKHAIESEM